MKRSWLAGAPERFGAGSLAPSLLRRATDGLKYVARDGSRRALPACLRNPVRA